MITVMGAIFLLLLLLPPLMGGILSSFKESSRLEMERDRILLAEEAMEILKYNDTGDNHLSPPEGTVTRNEKEYTVDIRSESYDRNLVKHMVSVTDPNGDKTEFTLISIKPVKTGEPIKHRGGDFYDET